MTEAEPAITVRLFAVLRERAGIGEVVLPAAEIRTVGEAAEALFARYPELSKYRRTIRFARNLEYADAEAAVDAGDELAFITPVSGG